MPENLIVIAYLTAKAGKESEARKNIRALVSPTQAEKGCIVYDLHEMHGESTKFLFYEVWKSAEDLGAHANSVHLGAFQKIAPEFLVGPAEITKWKKVE